MPSKIEWTDETWPVVTGCTPVSAGCANCYAARMAATRLKHHPRYAGLAEMRDERPRWTGEVRLNHDVLGYPASWRKPRRVFVASMGDLFHEDVSDDFIFDVLTIVAENPQHTFQILTKRPKRMAHLWRYAADETWPNLWLGVTIENQDEMWRLEHLVNTPAAVRFVSHEPLLSAIDYTAFPIGPRDASCGKSALELGLIHWLIVGGETGPNARPMHPDWAWSLRDQCQTASVPFFFKAWGQWTPYNAELHERILANWQWRSDWELTKDTKIKFMHVSGSCDPTYKETTTMLRVDKKRAGRLLDGVEWNEMPEVNQQNTFKIKETQK